jgi:NADH dehydrogenase [ubiquinone] 1 alpha subcomplex assembly factor 6
MNFSKKWLIRPPNVLTFTLRNNSTNSSAEYCMNLVKNYDYENFIGTLLLKKASRSCAFAVRSFNVEVARVAEQVSEKDIGLMRIKFWEDTLDKCFAKDVSKIPRHPVALELSKVSYKSYKC